MRSTRWIIAIGLAALTAAAFWQVAAARFLVFDDDHYVVNNPQVTAGLTWAGVKWAFSTVHLGNWHPITWLSLMLDARLWGLNPAAFHLHNLAIHTLNVLLLFRLLRRLTGRMHAAAMMAALWAVHPLRVESVAWVSERKDVLAMFFGLMAMNAYFGFRIADCGLADPQSAIRNPKSEVVLTALFMAISLMCKPLFVTLPLLLLILELWPARGSESAIRDPKAAILRLWPFWLLSLAASAVAIYAQVGAEAASELQRLPLIERCMNAMIGYSRYLGKTLWPTKLAAIYPMGDVLGWKPMTLSAALLMTISVLCWRCRARMPLVWAGWCWYLVSLLPMIGLVQVGPQSIANRYSYLPAIGLLLMAMGMFSGPASEKPGVRIAVAILTGLAMGALLNTTREQTRHWRDSLSLFSYTLWVAPDQNWMAHYGLAQAYARAGMDDQAAAHFRETLTINPDRINAYSNLAIILTRQRKYEGAMNACRLGLMRDPNHPGLLGTMAILQQQQGKTDEAVVLLERAAAQPGADAGVINNLAALLAGRGQIDRAIALYRKALALEPGFIQARVGLAGALNRAGLREQALEELRRAMERAPDREDLRRLFEQWKSLP